MHIGEVWINGTCSDEKKTPFSATYLTVEARRCVMPSEVDVTEVTGTVCEAFRGAKEKVK